MANDALLLLLWLSQIRIWTLLSALGTRTRISSYSSIRKYRLHVRNTFGHDTFSAIFNTVYFSRSLLLSFFSFRESRSRSARSFKYQSKKGTIVNWATEGCSSRRLVRWFLNIYRRNSRSVRFPRYLWKKHSYFGLLELEKAFCEKANVRHPLSEEFWQQRSDHTPWSYEKSYSWYRIFFFFFLLILLKREGTNRQNYRRSFKLAYCSGDKHVTFRRI